MTYAESRKLQDLLLLVALVDNRRMIKELEKRQRELDEKYEKIKEKIKELKN